MAVSLYVVMLRSVGAGADGRPDFWGGGGGTELQPNNLMHDRCY